MQTNSLRCSLFLVAALICGCQQNFMRSNNLHPSDDPRSNLGRSDFRIWLEHPEALTSIATNLTPRVSLLILRAARDWANVQLAAPTIGANPIPRDGLIVGILGHTGTPVNGGWPLHLRNIARSGDRAHLAIDLLPDSYLPDGATCLELFVLPGIHALASVELNQVTYDRSGGDAP